MRINLKDIKKDQVFYECEYGCNIQWVATEDARDVGEGHRLLASRNDGKRQELYCAAGFDHYLKLYTEPEYCRIHSDKSVTFPVA